MSVVDADVLALVLQDLDDKIHNLWTENNITFKHVWEAATPVKLEGTKYEFPVSTGGPGAGVAVRTGSELITSTKKDTHTKGNEEITRFLYHFTIPIKTMEEANSGAAGREMLKNYPLAAVQDINREINKQLVRGAYSAGTGRSDMDLSGFNTLNGFQTYRPGSEARRGFFLQAEPDAQTQTVGGLPSQGAASNPTPGWFNQYGAITSMQNNGLRVFRDILQSCNRQSDYGNTGPTLGLQDPESYNTMLDTLEGAVRTPMIAGDFVDDGAIDYIPFNKVLKLYREDDFALDELACWNGSAIQGVTYLLDKNWGMLTRGGKMFEIRKPMRDPYTEAMRWEIVVSCQPFSTKRRSQAVIIGTNRA